MADVQLPDWTSEEHPRWAALLEGGMDREVVDVRRYGDYQMVSATARLQNAAEAVANEMVALLEAGDEAAYREALERGKGEQLFPEFEDALAEFKRQVRNVFAHVSESEAFIAALDEFPGEVAV